MKNKMKRSFVRIIAGKWRSRRVYFDDAPGLRPTQDRVRETVFNWLQQSIQSTTCLDLFAGSGVLGFEALSRGAQSVTFVDSHFEAVNAIKQNARLLEVENQMIYHASIPCDLQSLLQKKYDIVFLDPPFSKPLLQPSLQWLLANDLITSKSLIYFETDHEGRRSINESVWEIVREKKTKNIVYGLLHLQ